MKKFTHNPEKQRKIKWANILFLICFLMSSYAKNSQSQNHHSTIYTSEIQPNPETEQHPENGHYHSSNFKGFGSCWIL